MEIAFEDVIDTPASMMLKTLVPVDLEPYKQRLDQILKAPAGTKVIPVKVGTERGEGAVTIKNRFNVALAQMPATKEYDPAKVKLKYRSGNPGETPIRLYVRWTPKTTE